MNDLSSKHCVPCMGGTPPMEQSEIEKLLKELGGDWQLNDKGHLYKAYSFKDFMGPVGFVNQIAEIAEREGHHPNLALTWGKCEVEIWTHKISGLTESDFILAAKIDGIGCYE